MSEPSANFMKKNSRVSNQRSSCYSSLIHDRHSAKAGDCGGRVKDGGDSGKQERVPSIDELWDMAEEKFPGKMIVLYAEFLAELGNFGERRSLLKGISTSEDARLNQISNKLAKATSNKYTQHFNSMFLAHFTTSQRETHSQLGSLDHKYMRLGEIDDETKDGGYDAKLHDVEHSFTSDKSLQLVLLFNHLLGHSIEGEPEYSLGFTNAHREGLVMGNIFDPVESIINQLFAFTSSYGFTVKADLEVTKVEGKGRPDFAVTVDTLYKGNKTPTTECVSVVEFKRPNSGLWIPWGPLTGQSWTEDEEAAFFELKKLELDDSSMCKKTKKLPEFLRDQTEKLLSAWKKQPLWDSAKKVLARTGSNRVRVAYRNAQNEASDGLTGSTSAQGGEKLTPFYYIETTDGKCEDITELLKAAGFKTSFDSCHNGLAQVASCAALNKCSRVAIADGLTVIAGSLKKLEKTERFSDPSDSGDVLDAHFYSTYMMQTHDQDSLVRIVKYFTEGVLLRSNTRRLGHQLLSFSDSERYETSDSEEYETSDSEGYETSDSEEYETSDSEGYDTSDSEGYDTSDSEGYETDSTTAADELGMKMREHKLVFSPENPGIQFPAWKESLLALTRGAREAVIVALADFGDKFPELEPKMDLITSDLFDVVKWYRRDMYEGFESDEPPFPGRSNSVARVQRHDDKRGAHFVLKEYYPDQDSVARMKRELEAYYRVSKLPDDERTRHVAELVSFGSLDLDEVPRLFLMLEYVEDSGSGADSDTSMADQSEISAEVDKVNGLLKSVGVYHNDLEHRNYRLQSDSDGGWHIKVFDFDHATCISPWPKQQPTAS